MILIIDNYDSFTYNLVQYCSSADSNIQVVRNDAITPEEIRRLAPDRIILSPGPGYPETAGICEEAVQALKGEIPILGVCLGHQAICEVFGGKIIHAKQLMHGKQSRIRLNTECALFTGIPKETICARYHSLIADRETLPDVLNIVAEDEQGEIMGVKHKDYAVYGLQFHPESILTVCGRQMLKNFIREVHEND